MKVELAKKAGFCFGVNRAVELAYQEAECKEKPVCSFGPVIHNEEVIADLQKKGVSVVNNLEELKESGCKTVIIRSHGVPESVQKELEADGRKVIDATCPFVKKIHSIVREYSLKGYEIIIIGSPDHSEVQGIIGWSSPGHTMVISDEKDAEELDLSGKDKICVVSQTTFNHNKFKYLVEIIRKKEYYKTGTVKKDTDLVIHNTICSATLERQSAAAQLAGQVDAMIVIGGLSSSNTKKLYDICSEHCKNTYFIQTKEDLRHSDFSRFGYVGITAGASTPNNIIEEVQKYVRNEL